MKKTFIYHDITVTVTGLKAQIERFRQNVEAVVDIHKHRKEINGTFENPHAAHYFSPFSPSKVKDPAKYEEDLRDLLCHMEDVQLPDLALAGKIQAVFNKHEPVVDNRISAAQDATERAERQKDMEADTRAREEEQAAVVAAYATKPEPLTLPADVQYITVQRYFNNSDSMSDYFDQHCTLDNLPFLLAVCDKKGPEREDRLRRVLALYPELAAHEWTWKSEKHSMGHGNYLESKIIGESVKKGGPVVSWWWEISFCRTYGKPVQIHKFKGETAPAAATPAGPVADVTVRRNETLNGIEVIFSGRPQQDIINFLKGCRFRWHRVKKLWYGRYDAALLTELQQRLTA